MGVVVHHRKDNPLYRGGAYMDFSLRDDKPLFEREGRSGILTGFQVALIILHKSKVYESSRTNNTFEGLSVRDAASMLGADPRYCGRIMRDLSKQGMLRSRMMRFHGAPATHIYAIEPSVIQMLTSTRDNTET